MIVQLAIIVGPLALMWVGMLISQIRHERRVRAAYPGRKPRVVRRGVPSSLERIFWTSMGTNAVVLVFGALAHLGWAT